MKRASRQIVDIAAEVLNRLTDDPSDETINITNSILKAVAEGGYLVSARETDGTLVGFVPRYCIPTKESALSNPEIKS